MEQQQISSLEQLTLLQQELGYKKGDISTVALLGLIGEAGEVLNETTLATTKEDSQYMVAKVLQSCIMAEIQKKEIRRGATHTVLSLEKTNEDKFDAELSDCFYYLNILAMNRGLTIEDLARMSHDKVRAKQASGGSSEDRKTT